MSLKLVFPGGEHAQVLLGPGVSRIGSDPAAQIVLEQPGVLPQHCQLHVTASGAMLDIARGTAVSVNGREVNGLIALRPGDTVTIARIAARLASFEDAASGELPRSANDEDPGATTVRPVMPMYVLRGVTGGVFGRSYPVQIPITVGRSPECDIVIDAAGLSRLHARLTPYSNGVRIEDLSSTNGTFVNDHRISRYRARIGDDICFDKVRFRLAGAGMHAAVEPKPTMSTAPVQELRRSWVWWAWSIAIGGAAVVLAILMERSHALLS